MNVIAHINISAFPMILLAVIFVSMRRRSIQTTDNRLFSSLVKYTFLLLLAELLSWVVDGLDFRGARALCILSNLAYFALLPSMSLVWLRYVYFHVNKRLLSSVGRLRRLLLTLPLAVCYVMLLASWRTGWIFTVDELNFYVRGSLYYLPNLVCTLYMLAALTLEMLAALSRRGGYRKKQNLSFAAFTAIPIAAGALQALAPGVWITLPFTAIAELLMYMYLQRQAIRKDALTGINNRGCFDAYLNSALEQEEKRRGLCLFMLDLDNFKRINDSFGHAVGDEALIRSAAVLAGFLHGTDAFLARYGGDEFCILRHCESIEEAEAVSAGLEEAFKRSNLEGERQYVLSCSVGYCLLADGHGAAPEELVRAADAMLYRQKKRRGAR